VLCCAAEGYFVGEMYPPVLPHLGVAAAAAQPRPTAALPRPLVYL
jgi:hypothetical protein